MPKLLLLLFSIIVSSLLQAQDKVLKDEWYKPWDPSANMVVDSLNNRLIINTSVLVSPQKNGFVIDASADTLNTTIPIPNGEVYKVIPDGTGGWYVAGDFTAVGDSPRRGLAHIDSQGSVTPFNLDIVGPVFALDIHGDTLYFGGNFLTVSGLNRSRLAAVDLNTETVISWSPQTNDAVYSLSIMSDLVYIGGNFTSIDGNTRTGLASVDRITGSVTNWNVVTNDPSVTIQSITDTHVYISGNFSQVNTVPRNRLAAVDRITGQLTSWDPSPNNFVNSLVLVGDTAYVSGMFTTIGSQPRNFLAAVDLITGAAFSWNPNPDMAVDELFWSNEFLYIHGSFTTINNASINKFAKWDPSTASFFDFVPELNVDGVVNSITQYGNQLYVGGNAYADLVYRDGLAALDIQSGKPTAFNPEMDGFVFSMDISDDNKLYFSGNFYQVQSVSRTFFASIDLTNDQLTSWSPYGDMPANKLVIDDLNQRVYITGEFSTINGVSRNRLASIDKLTGFINSWNPQLIGSGTINAMIATNQGLYVGGVFSTIGGEQRSNLAYLDGSTGLASSWNPSMNDAVRSMVLRNDSLFVGGDFTSVGAVNRNHLALFHGNNFDLADFNVQVYGKIYSMAINKNKLFVGGESNDFNQIGNASCYLISEINISLACGKFDWYPIDNNFPYSQRVDHILVHDNLLFISGDLYYYENHLLVFSNQVSNDADITINTFVLPSSSNICNGQFFPSFEGDPYFYYRISDYVDAEFITSAMNYHNDLCPGVYSLVAADNDYDVVTTALVIPVDSNYVFNNPFIDSIAVDSLGSTIEDCNIYYNSIDTAFIDSIFANGNTVTVIWNIVDSTGSNFDTSSYVLNNGNGVYYLQLSVFCPTRAIGEYFTVTEAIYFEDEIMSTEDLSYKVDELFELFPNPTNDRVTIRFEAPDAGLVVYDTQGKRVTSQRIQSGETISLANVEPGVYLFEFNTIAGNTVKRVVKR